VILDRFTDPLVGDPAGVVLGSSSERDAPPRTTREGDVETAVRTAGLLE